MLRLHHGENALQPAHRLLPLPHTAGADCTALNGRRTDDQEGKFHGNPKQGKSPDFQDSNDIRAGGKRAV